MRLNSIKGLIVLTKNTGTFNLSTYTAVDQAVVSISQFSQYQKLGTSGCLKAFQYDFEYKYGGFQQMRQFQSAVTLGQGVHELTGPTVIKQKREIQKHSILEDADKKLHIDKTFCSDSKYVLFQPVYDKEYIRSCVVQPAHLQPKTISDRIAYTLVETCKTMFDFVTRFKAKGGNSKEKWLMRCIYLETIAGVPGMVAAMTRHLNSLRIMRPDHGWIHTLLEEAENERMHLLTFMAVKKPGLFMRTMVLIGQGVFFNMFFVSYLLAPKYCHRFVGYLEEMAIITYSKLIQEIEEPNGTMKHWQKQQAPQIAIEYWKLEPSATMVDVVYAIRADEANHRHVNHTFATMGNDSKNPFGKGHHVIKKDQAFYGPQN